MWPPSKENTTDSEDETLSVGVPSSKTGSTLFVSAHLHCNSISAYSPGRNRLALFDVQVAARVHLQARLQKHGLLTREFGEVSKNSPFAGVRVRVARPTDMLAGARRRTGSNLDQLTLKLSLAPCPSLRERGASVLQSAIESPDARICASRPNSAALFISPSAGRSTSTKTGGL